MAEQPHHTEVVEQLKLLDYAFQIQERIGMYIAGHENYYCVINFFVGFDFGVQGNFFHGFREFLVTKYGEPRSLTIAGMIPLLCFGDDAYEIPLRTEYHTKAINYFFAMLREFRDGLQETEYLLRSPANAQRILTALERAKSEYLPPTTIDSLRAELNS